MNYSEFLHASFPAARECPCVSWSGRWAVYRSIGARSGHLIGLSGSDCLLSFMWKPTFLSLYDREKDGVQQRERESTCRLLVTLVFMGPPGPVITALLLHGRVCLSARSAKWDMQRYLECGAARPTQWRMQDERQGGAETIEMLICVKI